MKVKVKHSVVPDPDGIDAMINTIIAATKVVYATEIDEAIYGVQMAFKHASLPRYGPAARLGRSTALLPGRCG